MSTVLGLDIGTKHTGCALLHADTGVPVIAATLEHQTTDELLEQLASFINEKNITELVIGMPLLPNGTMGQQAEFTQQITTQLLQNFGLPTHTIDERYSNPRSSNDDHSQAALDILQRWSDSLSK